MIILSFIKPYWKSLLFVLVLSVIGTVLFTLQPLVGKFIIDDVFIEKTTTFERALGLAVLLLLSLFGISTFTRFVYMKTNLKIMVDMRTAFYRHLLNIPLTVLKKRRVGDLTSRINEDLGEIQRVYTDSVLQMVNLGLTFLFSFSLLLVMNWKMALFCMAMIPALVWGTHKFKNILFNENMKIKQIAAYNHSFLFESLSSNRFIRSANLYSTMQGKYQDNLEKMNAQTIKVTIINTCAQGVPQLVIWITTIAAIWFLGTKVLAETLSLGALLAFTAYQANLFSSVQGFAQLYVRIIKGKVALTRVQQFFSHEVEVDGTKELTNFESSIEIRRVRFGYDDYQEVLSGVDLTINKGEKIALVGQNGCGKSTLVQLLARTYRPIEGEIYCDGKDIQTITNTSWHKRIALVSHDDPIFFGTINEFLRLGRKDITEQEIRTTLDEVGLSEVIEQRPEGLQARLDEKGMNLSAGQKQRLLLARAFIQNPDILLLDEATSHLDEESEQNIYNLLQEKMLEKTIIIISHRIENLNWVNRVITMDQGRIETDMEVYIDARLAKSYYQ